MTEKMGRDWPDMWGYLPLTVQTGPRPLQAAAAAPVRWLRVVSGKLSARRVIGTASTLPESLILGRFLKLTLFS
jgi:hypothetical protein